MLQSAVEDLKKLLLQNGYPQGIVTLNINDVLNRNKNKPTEPVAKVLKKDVIVLFSYIGLHSSLITKRLKYCLNRFYTFVNVKVIFQNTRCIKSFFPYKDRLNRSQLYYPKSFTKLVAATIFTLGKRSEDITTGKRNISRPFWNMITLLQLLITLKQPVTASKGTILTFWHPARLTITVKLRRPCLFKSYSQNWMPMLVVKSFYSSKEAFSMSLYRQFPFETS